MGSLNVKRQTWENTAHHVIGKVNVNAETELWTKHYFTLRRRAHVPGILGILKVERDTNFFLRIQPALRSANAKFQARHHFNTLRSDGAIGKGGSHLPFVNVQHGLFIFTTPHFSCGLGGAWIPYSSRAQISYHKVYIPYLQDSETNLNSSRTFSMCFVVLHIKT